MPSEKILKNKQQTVTEIADDMKNATTVVFVDARGLTVEEDTELRVALRKNDVKYKVRKNTLALRAAESLGYTGLEEYLKGPTTIACAGTYTDAAKVLSKYEGHIATEVVFQSINALPVGYKCPEERLKPWGTNHAVLMGKDVINEPFAVINADDYYGKEAYKLIHDYLVEDHSSDKQFSFCMAGFILGNTLSDNGGVTRGICIVNEEGNLIGVKETSGIVKTASGAACDDGNGNQEECDINSHVSMNMWGFTPDFLDELESGFKKFLSDLKQDDVKSEYLLPMIVDGLIKENRADVSVLETRDKWFGVTYKEDKPVVVESICKLIEQGEYPEKLY